MSDRLARVFKTQVTTSMETAIRRAVFEIVNIFENTVHDYQMELAQKGEEVAHLKIKLQTAELKLKDREFGNDKGKKRSKETHRQTRTQLQAATQASRQTSPTPQAVVEVPDKRCAPLGSETATKQYDGVCPSVRLRSLFIPLQHIPILKHEVVNCDIDSYLKTRNFRRSKRISALKEGQKPVKELQVSGQNAQPPFKRNERNLKTLLINIKRESFDSEYFQSLKISEKNLTGKAKRKGAKRKRKTKDSAAAPKSAEHKTVKSDGDKMWTCKICSKSFESKLSCDFHTRWHMRCKGCKKHFPSKHELKCHKLSCKKIKKCLAVTATKHSKRSSKKEKTSSPSKKRTVNQKESEHHSCSFCPKRFCTEWGLKLHISKIHKHKRYTNDLNGDLEWTKPLEEIEEDFTSAAAK